ncbi:MAG: hypothetical protein N3D15_09040 [Syntrophorhabdaceae bacterium]|nr:hypothetical protein [Syntrophorhabdaceae bacterium]
MKKTLEELNNLPLNNKSREMLICAGEEPDSSCLYCVQLAIWGIDKIDMEVEHGIKEFIYAMPKWREARLMNFFMLPLDGSESDFNWEDASTPEGLAEAIIKFIEDKITIHFPFYLSAE